MYLTFAILCVFYVYFILYVCCHWRNNKWWWWWWLNINNVTSVNVSTRLPIYCRLLPSLQKCTVLLTESNTKLPFRKECHLLISCAIQLEWLVSLLVIKSQQFLDVQTLANWCKTMNYQLKRLTGGPGRPGGPIIPSLPGTPGSPTSPFAPG